MNTGVVSQTTGVPFEWLADMNEELFAAIEERALKMIEARAGK